jgi:hypothetical protein
MEYSIYEGFDSLKYMNVWRIMADVTHAVSKCILIFAIHRNSSAEGSPSPPLFLILLPVKVSGDRKL